MLYEVITGETAMRFMIIVKATKDSEAGVMPEEKLIAAMATYHEELAKAGALLDRITSYNVCYTKLLRLCLGRLQCLGDARVYGFLLHHLRGWLFGFHQRRD